MNRVVFIMLLFFNGWASAQSDTVRLKEVMIYGLPMSRYSSGTKVVQLVRDNETNLLYKGLSEQNSIYFKSYGNNQLSTIALRGTSASHTAVLWNGININSPTLGQTDFSLLPVFLMEDIALQYGTASSQYGTDALGGSVILSQAAPQFEKGTQLQFQQQNGSFGRNFTGAKATIGTGKWEFRTKAFTSFIANNFQYDAPSVGHTKTQNDASVSTQGIDQQIHLALAPTQQLSLEGMYINNFRNIQPTITNDNPDGTLGDINTRLALNYKNELRKGTLFATAGYASGKETYNVSDVTKTGQLNLLVSLDLPTGSKSAMRYGVQAARYEATTGNYPGTVSEARYDGFMSYRQLLGPANLSVNLRQSWYASRYAPFAPSLGVDVALWKNSTQRLTLKSQASRGYRIPTLNDRYWIPGGNPDLKPEDALHAEGGLSWNSNTEGKMFKTDLTYFNTWTKEWIIWLPASSGIWSPSNLQRVNAAGIEFSALYSNATHGIPFQTGINYSYTRSTNEKGLSDYDHVTVGKQLPYVPFHLANAFLKTSYKTWSWQVRLNYTGLRYTNLDNSLTQSLDPYLLLDTWVGKTGKVLSTQCTLRLEANNIFNVYYETMQSHAMPGINYGIHLIINFKTNQKS